MPILQSSTEEAFLEPQTDEAAVTFDEFKAALGSAAAKYTDEQINHMRLTCDKLADVLFERWIKEVNQA